MDLFPNGVAVSGFPWCGDEHKPIGVGSLTAKRLCRHHNSKLSKADAAATIYFKALHDQFESTAKRRTVRVSRHNLERWFLKTAINLSLAGTASPWPSTYGTDKPIPSKLVQIAFGRTFFKKPAGIYLFDHPTRVFDAVDAVHASFFLDDAGHIVACLFEFGGVPMLLWVDKNSPLKSIFSDQYSIHDFTYRPLRSLVTPTDHPELIVEYV